MIGHKQKYLLDRFLAKPGIAMLRLVVGLIFCSAVAFARVEQKVWQGCMVAMTGNDRAPVAVHDAAGNEVLDPYYAFDRKGLTLVDSDYVLRCEGGIFYGEDTRDYLALSLRNSGNSLTLGLYLHPRTLESKIQGCIAAYGDPKDLPLVSLIQKENKLLLIINEAKEPKVIELCALENLDPLHLMVSVSGREIIAYRNGAKCGNWPGVSGDITQWPAGILFFGNANNGKFPWRGSFEFFEFYNKALDHAAVKTRYDHAVAEIKNRPPRATITFEGILNARSEYPKPWDPGFTYSEVLSICEYSVEKVLSGEYSGKTIRVAEWMYVDRIFLTNSQKAIGSVSRLTVDQLDQRSNLTTTERADTLDIDIDAVVYYAPGPIEALPPDKQPEGK